METLDLIPKELDDDDPVGSAFLDMDVFAILSDRGGRWYGRRGMVAAERAAEATVRPEMGCRVVPGQAALLPVQIGIASSEGWTISTPISAGSSTPF
jgi:hypothetical protein